MRLVISGENYIESCSKAELTAGEVDEEEVRWDDQYLRKLCASREEIWERAMEERRRRKRVLFLHAKCSGGVLACEMLKRAHSDGLNEGVGCNGDAHSVTLHPHHHDKSESELGNRLMRGGPKV